MAIVYRTVFQYRRAFYEQLRSRLDERGIDLVLVYGQPGGEDRAKHDSIDLPWAQPIENRIIRLGQRELVWQPALRHLRGADLVIVEPASRMLLNYLLLSRQLAGRQRVAFWGHGYNARKRPDLRVGKWAKERMSRSVHWWFAYNQRSVSALRELGFPEDRITDTQNSIDTGHLLRLRRQLEPEALERLRAELGIRGRHVGAWVGGMVDDKMLPFLLDACRLIRAEIPDFEMLFLGAGPEEGPVRAAAREEPWIHSPGPRFDEDKIRHLALAQLLLMPAAVGLVVQDSFALGVPLLTLQGRYHGPEIEYLRNDENGVVIPDTSDPAVYARAAIDLFNDPARMQRLVDGCLRAAEKYSVEEMARRFADGIEAALRA